MKRFTHRLRRFGMRARTSYFGILRLRPTGSAQDDAVTLHGARFTRGFAPRNEGGAGQETPEAGQVRFERNHAVSFRMVSLTLPWTVTPSAFEVTVMLPFIEV